jgi:hypothetical protein
MSTMSHTYYMMVMKNGYDLMKVPYSERTYDLCMEAVLKNGGALMFVPESSITYEMSLAAAKNGCSMEYIPRQFITYELCMAFALSRPLDIGRIPYNMLTEEMCLAVVKKCPNALYRIPKEYHTFDVCMTAIRKNHTVRCYVKNWTPELKAALTRNKRERKAKSVAIKSIREMTPATKTGTLKAAMIEELM